MVTAGLTLALAGVPLRAQQRPVELGIDGGLIVDFVGGGGSSLTRITFPTQVFRAAFYISDQTAIEPQTTFTYFTSGNGGAASVAFFAAVMHHLTADPRETRTYFRIGGGFQGILSTGNSALQPALGAAFGVKLPQNDRLAIRLESFFQRWFPTDDFGAHNQFSFLVGVSFFTK